MAFFSGRNGFLKYQGKEVAKVRDWSLNTQVNLLQTTVLRDYAETYTPGVKGASGSCTLMYYRLEPGESATYEQFTSMLNRVMQVGTINTGDLVRMELNVGNLSPDNVTFDAYINSADLATSAGELTTVSIQFTVQGDFVDVISAA